MFREKYFQHKTTISVEFIYLCTKIKREAKLR